MVRPPATPPPTPPTGHDDNVALGQLLSDRAKAAADKAIAASTTGWLARADENQKLALVGVAAAVALGPGGQGILAAMGSLFGKAALPNSEQLLAVGWLLLITAPVAAWCFVVALIVGRGSVATVLMLAAVAAYAGGALLAAAGVPAQLGDLYCFAAFTPTGIEYEHACHAFDAAGFLTAAGPHVGSPSGSVKVMEWAMVYVADARGTAMAAAGVVGGLSAGYLARRAA